MKSSFFKPGAANATVKLSLVSEMFTFGRLNPVLKLGLNTLGKSLPNISSIHEDQAGNVPDNLLVAKLPFLSLFTKLLMM